MSPSGREVAAGGILSAGISIWDVEKGTPIRQLTGLKGGVQALAYSLDGRMFATGHNMIKSTDTSVYVFQAGTDTMLQRLDPPRIITRDAPKGVGAVKSLHYSPDSQFLAVGFAGGAVGMYEAATGSLKQSFPTPAALDGPLAYSPSGQYLAFSERIRTEDDLFHHHVIHLIEVTTGRIERTFSGHTDLITALAFSPDGKYLASGSNTGAVRMGFDKKKNQGVERRNEDPIRIWDVETGAIVKELAGHAGSVRSLVFYHNGQYLVSGSWDKTIKIWDLARGALVSTLTGHNNLVDSIVVSPDEKYLVSGGNSPDIKVWERRQ
jgi:tricorn protease-like protein